TEKRKILVVDDNHDAAETLSIFLKLKGNEVQVRYDGYVGIKLAESFLPDVVVLDIGMPGLDGYQSCRLMRDSVWGGTMTIIALTGYGQEDDIRKSMEAGFDAHLLKPVDIKQLMSIIDPI
ncbi:MAG: hypothetical protein JWQ74_3673, partial [Marmoricola sp.]|nr:hypothetical protein [Marmoricola sp.]